MLIKNTKLDLSVAKFLPGSGRGISESLEWEEHGEFHRDANGTGFVMTIPGEDKLLITFTGSGDWAAPALMHVALLTEMEVVLIDAWQIPFEAGQTSVILPRAAWSDEDMVVFLDDRTILPRTSWTWAGPKIVSITAQPKSGFVEFRPKITAFLIQKPKDRGEWSGKVNWTVGLVEK
ncbi:hypothetical protein GOC55_12995 [Sinorhizobium medicae]|nr:hypothetical protein [Sinorhizobium medicae]